MKAIMLVIATACFFCLFAQVVMAKEDRMDGGYPAYIDKHPFICYVTEAATGKLVSIGTIVDKNHVLTTLISISITPRELVVYCGTENRNEEIKDNSFGVNQMNSEYRYGITLLKLDHSINELGNMKPIQMADSCEDNAVKPGLVVSYATAGELRKLPTTVLTRDKCPTTAIDYNQLWLTCATTLHFLTPIDIGAPLIVLDRLYGMALSKPEDDIQLFRKVGCYIDWINDQLKV